MKKNNLLNKVITLGIMILFVGISIIPSTGSREIEKFIQKDAPQQEIDGLYYMRHEDPGNVMDVGSLLRSAPVENGRVSCGSFVVIHFAEEDDYTRTNRIFNIYYHIWQKAPEYPFEGEEFDLGYSTSGGHSGLMNESIMINTSEYISLVDNHRLVQTMQFTNPEIAVFEGDEIYNFSTILAGNGPWIRTNPNQYSFVILNLEDNETLRSYDRDADLLNDYDELFVHVTNPFDNDTDDDGVSDYDECVSGSDPNDYNDCNDPPDTPEQPDGPISGFTMIEYTYTTSTTDSESHLVYYKWDWGDNNFSEWLGPYNSGEICEASYAWVDPGIYNVKVKAKDDPNSDGDLSDGLESTWSEPLSISIFIAGDLDNDGDVDLSDLAILLASYGKDDGGDIDGDGDTDLNDLAILLANYGRGT